MVPQGNGVVAGHPSGATPLFFDEVRTVKTPYNYIRFARVFPTLKEEDQIKLISLIASPGKVRNAFKQMKRDKRVARQLNKCFCDLMMEVLTP